MALNQWELHGHYSSSASEHASCAVYLSSTCSYPPYPSIFDHSTFTKLPRTRHCCRQIDCEQIRSRINQQLIAGHSGHKGFHGRNVLQLVVDWFCYIFARNQFAYIEDRSNEPLLWQGTVGHLPPAHHFDDYTKEVTAKLSIHSSLLVSVLLCYTFTLSSIYNSPPYSCTQMSNLHCCLKPIDTVGHLPLVQHLMNIMWTK